MKARKDVLRRYLPNVTLEVEALHALEEIYMKYNEPAGTFKTLSVLHVWDRLYVRWIALSMHLRVIFTLKFSICVLRSRFISCEFNVPGVIALYAFLQQLQQNPVGSDIHVSVQPTPGKQLGSSAIIF